MKPNQQHKDTKITNISFDNLTGSIYIIDPNSNEENQLEFMLTSPRTNGVDNFVPSHHLSLITQPVLGARSRSKRKTRNIILETSTATKDKLDSMTNSRRSSYNDSPPLILPINRVDTLQYQKKTNSSSHQESSDSGLDLSLSTNSSVQIQQYPQQHIQIHRPLSALNEDSTPDDGYHDEHLQGSIKNVRLRFPPVSFGRNRSMEDMIDNNTHEQQHRSSSFSDERQQKFVLQYEQKLKRTSDGTISDLIDTSQQSTEYYRRTNYIQNEHIYPHITQQHRSLNDLTNKTSNKVFPVRNESNMSTMINNLSTTHTMIRKPNTSTLKPLRKKTKLNIIAEPSIPLTSSRLANYDEQINTRNGTTSSSSNQTTPRSIRPLGQQQIKSKTSTPLGHYSNQEQLRAQVNRSVVERQHPPNFSVPSRRGVIQQLIPFDASPSKINNLLLRHHVQQNQPIIIFHPSSSSQMSPTRQIKQTLPTLYDEETISNVQEEKRKQIKSKEYQEKKPSLEYQKLNQIHQKEQRKIKIKDNQQSIISKTNHRRTNSQEQFEQTNIQRDFINSNQIQQEKEVFLEKNIKKKIEKNRFTKEDQTTNHLRQYQHYDNNTSHRDDNRQRKTIINHSNTNTTNERYGSGRSSNTTTKSYHNQNNNYRRQQQNMDHLHINRDEKIDGEQIIYKSKPTGINLKNKTQNENNQNRMIETNDQYELDYIHGTQKSTPIDSQSQTSKVHYQTNETPTTRNSSIQSQIDQNRQLHTSTKYQLGYQSKSNHIKQINNTNIYDSRQERETSRLSHLSKTDSIQLKQKTIQHNSTENLQTKSPRSSSIISDHQNDQQQFKINQKLNIYQSEVSTSSSSHQELIQDNSNTPYRTYRLINNDQQQSIDGKYVLPSNNLKVSSVIDSSLNTSSRHTYPFTFTPDFENNDDTLIDEDSSRTIQNKKSKSILPDVYTLSNHNSPQNTIHSQNSPSPLVHLSSKNKYSSPSSSKKITKSIENDEMTSNYDSDDGWSDDSAELLYVDERYVTDKRKITPPSHLPSQQHHHYQLQQQNVLLQ